MSTEPFENAVWYTTENKYCKFTSYRTPEAALANGTGFVVYAWRRVGVSFVADDFIRVGFAALGEHLGKNGHKLDQQDLSRAMEFSETMKNLRLWLQEAMDMILTSMGVPEEYALSGSVPYDKEYVEKLRENNGSKITETDVQGNEKHQKL